LEEYKTYRVLLTVKPAKIVPLALHKNNFYLRFGLNDILIFIEFIFRPGL